MHPHRKRPSLSDAHGFTLVELLVVILLLGILATIAMPAFLGQRVKAQDTEAQAMVRTAATALATYQMDNDTYDATRADLEALEPAIRNASPDFDVSGTTSTFTITERSRSQTDFTLDRDAAAAMTRSCSDPGRGLCRPALDAAGNRW